MPLEFHLAFPNMFVIKQWLIDIEGGGVRQSTFFHGKPSIGRLLLPKLQFILLRVCSMT